MNTAPARLPLATLISITAVTHAAAATLYVDLIQAAIDAAVAGDRVRQL